MFYNDTWCNTPLELAMVQEGCLNSFEYSENMVKKQGIYADILNGLLYHLRECFD